MIPIHKAGYIGLLLCAGTLACSDVHQPPTDIPPLDQMLARLAISPRGLTMAIGDRAQLTVNGLNVYGDVIPLPRDADTIAGVVYRSSDTSRLRVNLDGELQAAKITAGTNPIRVFISWMYRGTTKFDTVYVKITQTRPVKLPTSLSIHPLVGDSANLGYGGTKTIQVRAYAEDNTLVPGVYAYLDTERRRERLRPDDINPITGLLSIVRKGPFWVYTQSLVYGTLLQDSVEWIGTERTAITINETGDGPGSLIINPALFLAPCGSLTVVNGRNISSTGAPVSMVVELDDPSQTGVCKPGDVQGDFGELQSGQRATRVFPHAGEFTIMLYEPGASRKLIRAWKIVVQ